MTIELIGWWVMAALAVACAVGMVSTKNPVHSALYLVGCLVALAVIYLILSAPVLFAVQLIVYAGAIMILFLFVVMFFPAPTALTWQRPKLKGQLFFGGILVVVFMLLLVWGLWNGDARMVLGYEPGADFAQVESEANPQMAMGNPKPLGIYLFSYHVLPFELTSILLLAALLGALLVARDIKSEGRSEVPRIAARKPQAEEPEVDA